MITMQVGHLATPPLKKLSRSKKIINKGIKYMNKFSWSKAIGFGFLIWAIMAVTLWALGGITSMSTLWAHGLVAVAGTIAAFFLAQNVKAESGMQAAGYGIAWVAIVLILDFVVTHRFDVHIFAIWQYWLGAALVFVSPWIETEVQQNLSASHQA